LAILVRVPPDQLEGLVEAAVTKHGNMYHGEIAKLIGASKESLEGRTSFYLISLMKLCGLAEANLEDVLKKSRIVSQRGALTREISGDAELKEVIDDALEGFQTLISQSFRDAEKEGVIDKPVSRKR
jgi:hypothetical protein